MNHPVKCFHKRVELIKYESRTGEIQTHYTFVKLSIKTTENCIKYYLSNYSFFDCTTITITLSKLCGYMYYCNTILIKYRPAISIIYRITAELSCKSITSSKKL